MYICTYENCTYEVLIKLPVIHVVILLMYKMNDLPLELLEMVLMRSFLMLYLSDYETDDYVWTTTYRGIPYITAKFRRVEHWSFALLSSVCWSWHMTLTGWPQSPTPAWLRHQLKKLIQCECTYIHYYL